MLIVGGHTHAHAHAHTQAVLAKIQQKYSGNYVDSAEYKKTENLSKNALASNICFTNLDIKEEEYKLQIIII